MSVNGACVHELLGQCRYMILIHMPKENFRMQYENKIVVDSNEVIENLIIRDFFFLKKSVYLWW